MTGIDIAVPTYNCGPYLDSFVESVLAQQTCGWRLVVRDDGSSDGTAERLAAWKQRLGDRMAILEDSGTRNLGMIGNYNAVLAATSAPLVMFADPDDVWQAGKMALLCDAMRSAERDTPAETPLLICSDAAVVDSQLKPVADSFWRWSRMKPELTNVLHRMVVESPVLTSTIMVNRPLLDLAMPFTGAASCPDWWPALVASAFGKIVRLQQRTVLYRRHPANDSLDPLGASVSGGVRAVLSDIAAPRRRVERLLRQFAPQAAAFAARFRDRLSQTDLAALDAAANLPEMGCLARRWTVIRHGLWFGSPVKNSGLMLLL